MLVDQDGTFDQQVYLPLGLLYIASTLHRAGFRTELIDYQLFSEARTFDVSAFLDAIGETAPLVGISCMSNLLPFAILTAKELKIRRPAVRVVLGGVGPAPVAAEIVEAFPFVDTVVEGEGELVMLDLARGDCSRLPPRRIQRQLDLLPGPAYDLIDFDLYDAAPSIITSRGCPYKCTFCTEPYNFDYRVSFRSVPSILTEIEDVYSRSGRTMFLFQDDILPLKRSRFRELLAGLRHLSFPIQWKCFSRVDLMDDDLMEEMAKSGCVQVRYGIESGSNVMLDRIRKEFRIEKAYEVAVRSLEFFPSVHCSFIWGYPAETLAEFDETISWVDRFERAGITNLLFEFAPLPGSPLFKQHQEDLVFSADRYSFYVITGCETVRRDGSHAAREHPIHELIRSHPKIFSGFYQYENTLKLQKRQSLKSYNATRRTPVLNEFDL